jgi:metallo-beta-lactamase family protein
MSAHADSNEIMRWLHGFSMPPRQTFIVHGELTSMQALRARIERELGWTCMLPEHRQTVQF